MVKRDNPLEIPYRGPDNVPWIVACVVMLFLYGIAITRAEPEPPAQSPSTYSQPSTEMPSTPADPPA